MEKTTYLLLLLVSISIPLSRSFEPRVQFKKHWLPLFFGIAAMMLVFIPWDVVFTARGIWSFNHDYVLGWYILGLPIEEWLFFMVIPYCVMFTHEVLRYFFPRFVFPGFFGSFALILALAMVALALVFRHQTYTLVVMLQAALVLVVAVLMGAHKTWLSHFFLTYFVSLIPFLLVNGVLTSRPVVTYNDSENFGLRIHTIPVEDSIYLLGMMLLVALVYEAVGKRFSADTQGAS